MPRRLPVLMLLSVLVGSLAGIGGGCGPKPPPAGAHGGGPGTDAAAADDAGATLRLSPNVIAVEVTATSSRLGSLDTGDAMATWRVVDRDPEHTGWCENKADAGLGEALTLRFSEPTHLERVIIGSGSDPDIQPNTYARPTRYDVITDDGRTMASSEFPDGGLYAHIGLPAVMSVTIRIAAVDAKQNANVTCITNVELSTRQGAILHAIADVTAGTLAGLPLELPRLAAAVESCDRSELSATMAFPLPWRRGVEEGAYADVDALIADCKAGAGPRLIDAQRALDSIDQDRPGEILLDASAAGRWRLAWREGGWRLIATEAR